LGAVDAAEVAGLRIGPLVPDGHAVFLEPADVGVAAEEPEQLVEDALEVDLFGGDEGETLGEREAQLGTEQGIGPGARAIRLEPAVVDEVTEQLEIGLHLAP
jgi:hypothetical protein